MWPEFDAEYWRTNRLKSFGMVGLSVDCRQTECRVSCRFSQTHLWLLGWSESACLRAETCSLQVSVCFRRTHWFYMQCFNAPGYWCLLLFVRFFTVISSIVLAAASCSQTVSLSDERSHDVCAPPAGWIRQLRPHRCCWLSGTVSALLHAFFFAHFFHPRFVLSHVLWLLPEGLLWC